MLFSEEYRETRLRPPHIKYQSPRSAVILLGVLLFLIGAAFVAVLFLG